MQVVFRAKSFDRKTSMKAISMTEVKPKQKRMTDFSPFKLRTDERISTRRVIRDASNDS